MPVTVSSVPPQVATSLFARLYGGAEAEFAWIHQQLTVYWAAEDEAGTSVGALGLRPTPAHGAELLGGAFPSPKQHETALALLCAALAVQPQLYAYAEAHLLPAEALETAGLQRVSAYTSMAGPIPELQPEIPVGIRIVPLSEVADLDVLLAAQQNYSHRIGHTLVTPEAVQMIVAYSDGTLGRIAFDAQGRPVGLCRAKRDGARADIDGPAVHPAWAGTGLRRALLLSVCQAARAAGATTLTLQTWGDTEQERAEDLALGLKVDELNPIYSSVPL
jgi:GNAT superfamily N-acetyltransferase